MLSENLPVILFYGGIILLLFIFRKKFEIQNKIIAIHRTKIGLKAMQSIGTKYSEQIKILGYIGIGAGFIGMLFILFSLAQNLWMVISTPSATSGISLVIPGVKIPGSPLTPPLIIGWIALFFVIAIHEFSHGIVSVAHKVKVKASGIVFFGPLMGAFVEPDEKELDKRHETAQYSVYAAGPWSNVILAIFAFLILSFAINPGISAMIEPNGFTVGEVTPDMPAAIAGLPTGELITAVDGQTITSANEFVTELNFVRPGEDVIVSAGNQNYTITTGTHPDDERKAFLGVSGFVNEFDYVRPGKVSEVGLFVLKLLRDLFSWIGILSFGIGLANLLPLGPVDGGRMMLLASQQIHGKKKGIKVWSKISALTLLLLLVNLFWPAIDWFIGLI